MSPGEVFKLQGLGMATKMEATITENQMEATMEYETEAWGYVRIIHELDLWSPAPCPLTSRIRLPVWSILWRLLVFLWKLPKPSTLNPKP